MTCAEGKGSRAGGDRGIKSLRAFITAAAPQTYILESMGNGSMAT